MEPSELMREWAKFEAAIAAANIRGARPRSEDRRTIEAIIWRLDNGAKWRSIPGRAWRLASCVPAVPPLGCPRGCGTRTWPPVVAEEEPQLAFACIDGTVARAH